VAQLGKAEGNSPPNTSVSSPEANQPNGNILIVGFVEGRLEPLGVVWYLLVAKREIWLVGVSGMGKTEQSRNLLVMKRREKKGWMK